MIDYFGKDSIKKTGPDYFKADPTTKISKKHEKDIVKRSGGRRTPGSGNMAGCPGDIKDDMFLREAKATHGAGGQIKAEWLKNIHDQATETGKIALMELRFSGQVDPTPSDWIMISAVDFEILIQKLKIFQEKKVE